MIFFLPAERAAYFRRGALYERSSLARSCGDQPGTQPPTDGRRGWGRPALWAALLCFCTSVLKYESQILRPPSFFRSRCSGAGADYEPESLPGAATSVLHHPQGPGPPARRSAPPERRGSGQRPCGFRAPPPGPPARPEPHAPRATAG